MTTVEFFNLVYNHLDDNGIMMSNINMVSNDKNSINAALCDTSYSVFNNLYTFKVPYASGMEIFASKANIDLKEKINGISVDDYYLNQTFTRLKNDLAVYQDSGIRLYDDTADVEIRSMKALDLLINEELDYYRTIFKEKGLKALMDELFSN